MKTRYAKPFEGVQVKIPYETGMNPYSGLVDLFEKKDMLKKDGNRLKFVSKDGEEIKEYRKAWEAGGPLLDKVMNEFSEVQSEVTTDVEDEAEETVETVTEE